MGLIGLAGNGGATGGGSGLASVTADAPLSGQGTSGSHLIIANASGAAVGVIKLAGDLGGTATAPTVTNLSNVANASLPASGIAAVNPSSLTGTGTVPAAGLPAATAGALGAVELNTDLGGTATAPQVVGGGHITNGSLTAAGLANIYPRPGTNNYVAWTENPSILTATLALTAQTLYMMRIDCPYAFVVHAITLFQTVAGTGVQALGNCYVGLYDSGGTNRFTSADQSTAWGTGTGDKAASLGGTPWTTTGTYFYVAALIGTQSTTAAAFAANVAPSSTQINSGLTAAAYRCATNGTSATSLPASLTLSSNAAIGRCLFVGIA